jgi:hypothetical protein
MDSKIDILKFHGSAGMHTYIQVLLKKLKIKKEDLVPKMVSGFHVQENVLPLS